MIPVTRRGFFGLLAGVFTAAAAMPAAVEQWAMNTTPMMFKGVPFVFDENGSAGAVGFINRNTYRFWRNQQHAAIGPERFWRNQPEDGEALRRVYNECSRGVMQ